MQSPLEAVVELDRVMGELASLEEQLAGIPDWMQELHAEHGERRAEIEATEKEIGETTAARRLAEGQISDYQEKLKTYQRQLSQVRNEREYGALLQEIDLAKNQIKDLEEQALEALEAQEEQQERLTMQRDAFSALDTRHTDALEKWKLEKPELARRADVLRKRVSGLEAEIPAATLTFFKRVRARHQGQALATVLEVERVGKGPQMWHCGACHYRVRPQAVVEVADHGNIVLCDSCKRILVLEKAAT